MDTTHRHRFHRIQTGSLPLLRKKTRKLGPPKSDNMEFACGAEKPRRTMRTDRTDFDTPLPDFAH